MKPLTYVSRLLIMTLMLFVIVPVSAETKKVKIGNLWYNLHTYGYTYQASVTYEQDPNKEIVNGYQSAYDNSFYGPIVIPKTVNYGTVDYTVTEIEEQAFSRCVNIQGDVSIPNTVSTIGKKAFYYCLKLNGTLTLPSGITSISESAFDGCAFTGPLTIPQSVTSIGENAFAGCKFTGTLTIPSSVTSIGQYAFFSNQFTGDLIVPNSITKIENGVFAECSSLDGKVTLPDNLNSLGNSAFRRCFNIKSINIPSKITSIGDETFYYCRSLTNITIPSNVTSIGWDAFSYSGITGKLTIPAKVSSIDSKGAFCAMSNTTEFSVDPSNSNFTTEDGILCNKSGTSIIAWPAGKSATNYTIPSNIKTIAIRAFSGCKNLTGTLTIPNNITKIGDCAFEYCNNITDYIVLSETPATVEKLNWDIRIFTSGTPIIVPSNCGDKYRTASGWKDQADQIFEIGDANINQALTIADAVTVGNHIVGAPNNSFNRICADFNRDGNVNITDITLIINAILTNNPSGMTANNAPRKIPDIKALKIDDFSINDGNFNVNISLSDLDNVVALQADFHGKEGLTINEASIAPEFSKTHSLDYAKLPDGGLRVVLYSSSNVPLSLDIPIISLSVSGNDGYISAENCYAAAADGSETIIGYTGGMGSSSVNSVDTESITIESNGNTISIRNAKNKNAIVFDMAGCMIRNINISSECESIELPCGMYIVKIGDKSYKTIL